MRLQEVVRAFIAYGFEDWVVLLRLDRSFPFVRRLLSKRGSGEEQDMDRWHAIRLTFEELGPTFIKLGQILSSRTDMLPLELTRELAHLRDDVAPFSSEEVMTIIEDELGRPCHELFSEFDEKPAASASIAQVHTARTRSGHKVAVKVRRPGIEETVRVDLEILHHLAVLIEKYFPKAKLLNPTAVIEEFRKSITNELDFTRELRSLERFRVMFAGNPRTKVPEVFPEYSTRRVLTMEFIDGERLGSVESDTTGRFDKHEIARNGANLVLEQIFIHGFFHADPHPGNIYILPNNVVCFLDFGIVGQLRPRERETLMRVMIGAVNRDADTVTDGLLALTDAKHAVNTAKLSENVYDIIDEYIDVSLKNLDIGGMFTDLISLLVRFGLRMPTQLTLVTKALISIEGVGVQLWPDFNLVEVLKPFVRRLYYRRLNPRRILTDGYEIAARYGEFARDLPVDLREILKLVKTGNVRLTFRATGLEPIARTIDSFGVRIIFGLVLASIMVSSSLIIGATVPPTWQGISVIGLIGYGLAGLLGFGFIVALIVRMFRG